MGTREKEGAEGVALFDAAKAPHVIAAGNSRASWTTMSPQEPRYQGGSFGPETLQNSFPGDGVERILDINLKDSDIAVG